MKLYPNEPNLNAEIACVAKNKKIEVTLQHLHPSLKLKGLPKKKTLKNNIINLYSLSLLPQAHASIKF